MTQKFTVAFVVSLTYFMTPKGHGVIRGRPDLLYDPKGPGDLCGTPKGHGVIRGRLDLLYDPKGHGNLCGRFDLLYDPKRSRGHYRSA